MFTWFWKNWNETTAFEDAFFRPSRFIQASWGKGRQLVLVPVIFKIPDSCQALDLFVVLQNFRRDETPFIGTDTLLLSYILVLEMTLLGPPCDPSVGWVYLYVAARGVDMSCKIW